MLGGDSLFKGCLHLSYKGWHEKTQFIKNARRDWYRIISSRLGENSKLVSSTTQSNLQYSTFAVALGRVTPSYKKGNRPYNCFRHLLIADSHYIYSMISRYRFQIRQNVFWGNTGGYFALENVRNIILQPFFSAFLFLCWISANFVKRSWDGTFTRTRYAGLTFPYQNSKQLV